MRNYATVDENKVRRSDLSHYGIETPRRPHAHILPEAKLTHRMFQAGP